MCLGDRPRAPYPRCMIAIQVERLSKRYGDVLAVDGIDFTAATGATVGLLGGNGAGKTTTIAMLLGLLVPTAGRITVLGHDMATDRFAALARMNFSSPYISLPARLTVAENLRVYGHLYNVKRVDDRIGELAGDLDLAVLLDEPTSSLDPDTGDLVRTWLERYRDESGCTILLASHNMAEVERLCSHVLMLKQGRIVDQGSPQELLDG